MSHLVVLGSDTGAVWAAGHAAGAAGGCALSQERAVADSKTRDVEVHGEAAHAALVSLQVQTVKLFAQEGREERAFAGKLEEVYGMASKGGLLQGTAEVAGGQGRDCGAVGRWHVGRSAVNEAMSDNVSG